MQYQIMASISQKRTLDEENLQPNKRSKDHATNWTIVVCSMEKLAAIFVPDPQQWMVANIKEELEKKVAVPANEQIIYCNEKVLPEQLPLVDCEGMRNGVALLMCRKPFIINVYCSDTDIAVPVEVPVNNSLTMAELRSLIITRVGTRDCYLSGDPFTVVTIKDLVIEDSNELVSQYRSFQNGCSVVLTKVERASFQHPVNTNPVTDETRYAFVPPLSSSPFLSNNFFKVIQPWTLHIQQEDGSVVPIQMRMQCANSIYDIKCYIERKLSIETQLQQLSIGENVLEEYNENGQELFSYDYPAIHDGATLQLHLTEGMYVLRSDNYDGARHVNIPNPSKFTIRKLDNILHSCMCDASNRDNRIDVLARERPDDPVTSVPWLKDGMSFK